MRGFRYLVGSIPLAFLVVGLASAGSGVLTDGTGTRPVAGALLVGVGLSLIAALWLVGYWRGGRPGRD